MGTVFSGMIAWLFFALFMFVIGIAIMRWAFRINDIVNRLDRLIELQSGNDDIKPKSFMDGVKKGMNS